MRQQKIRARGVSRFSSIGVVALGLGAVLALAGCSAGQVAQTAMEKPAVNGALGKSGKLAIRDAVLVYPTKTKGVYPKGSDAELALTVVNRGVQDDKLVKVTSKAATSVMVQGSRVVPGGGTLVVGAPGKASTGGAPAGGASSSAEHPSSAPSSASNTADSAGAESGAEQERVGHVRIVLQDLKIPFRSGLTAKVTFVFEKAGSITVDMPIATPPPSEPSHSAGSGSGEGSEGGH